MLEECGGHEVMSWSGAPVRRAHAYYRLKGTASKFVQAWLDGLSACWTDEIAAEGELLASKGLPACGNLLYYYYGKGFVLVVCRGRLGARRTAWIAAHAALPSAGGVGEISVKPKARRRTYSQCELRCGL